MEYSLSSDDIHKLCPGIPIWMYPQLSKMNSTKDLFKGKNACIILILTSPSFGHWISVLQYPDMIQVHDSYGIPIDSELHWINEHFREENNEQVPHLSHLLQKDGRKITHNTYKLQSKAQGVNTCGRHASERVIKHSLQLNDYVKFLKATNLNSDEAVLVLTQKKLGH